MYFTHDFLQLFHKEFALCAFQGSAHRIVNPYSNRLNVCSCKIFSSPVNFICLIPTTTTIKPIQQRIQCFQIQDIMQNLEQSDNNIKIEKVKMKKDEQQISYATNKKNLQKSKIVFVGDQYVGKTSVITRFIKNTFDGERNPTIGIDFVSKNVALGGKMMRLQLWDTAGQERFRSLIPNYIRDCQAALIVFDLTNEQSFQNVPKWVDFVKEHRGDDALIVAIGNKLDLKEERKVEHSTAQKKFKDIGITYFQLSAKTGQNVEKMFQELCGQLMGMKSQTALPPLEIQQSKVISNVPLQRQIPKKAQPKQKQQKQPQKQAVSKPAGTKLTKANQQQRRVKQKQCC